MAHISYLPQEEIPEPHRVPDHDNIIQIHGIHSRIMRHHYELYRELMYSRGPLSRVQREMIGVVVSTVNNCHY